MKNFRIHWYNQEETVLVEPDLISAKDAEEARGKAMMKYEGREKPAPLIWAEEVI